MNDARSVSRRGLLAGGAGVGLALGLGPFLATGARADTFDYTSRADFDRFIAAYEASGAIGQPDENNETGALAWGQAYVLLGLVRMYEATKDRAYLNHLIRNIDLVLEQRDQERGVADYRGVSGPVWRAAGNYTAATTTLTDAAGKPLLQVRSAQGSVSTKASVTVSHTGGTTDTSPFTLDLHSASGTTVSLPDVDFDASSDRYVFRVVYNNVYNGTTRWSVRDVRPDHSNAVGLPVAGTTTLQPEPYAFAVHTGQLVYPIASFVRIVYRDPQLCRHPKYKGKANAYRKAVEAAIAFHNREYVIDPAGFGAYKWVKETPLPLDGSMQPLNQMNMLGATAAELYRATGSTHHRHRVLQLAACMRDNLALAKDAYSWHYWPVQSAAYTGWAATGDTTRDLSSFTQAFGGARQYEDLSHAALNLEFMTAAYRAGLAFTRTDMQRLAGTYVTNLAVGETGAHLTVAGGGTAPVGQLQQVPRWMPVAEWSQDAYTHALAVTRAQALQPTSGSLVGGFAYCVWATLRFGG